VKSFQLEEQHRNIPDEDLLADLRRVANEARGEHLTWALYLRHGRYGAETERKRFGSWNAALESAGLQVGKRWRVPDAALFENLADLWVRLGRQPRRHDLYTSGSRFSSSLYEQRFGTWRRALEAFVVFANASDAPAARVAKTSKVHRRSSLRQPSEGLRFKVMRRDHFRCLQCGASPAKDGSVDLHVDHVVPWSRGGETILDNLRTLCAKCNLGKGHLGEHEA
jgi:hypothetical protein